MQIEFKSLIQIGGMALEAEDRYFLGAIAANQIAYPNVWEYYSFRTLDTQGQDIEFWIAGYEVK